MNKAQLRKTMIRRRSQMSEEQIAAFSQEIALQIARLDAYRSADTLLAYSAIRGEADPAPLVSMAWEAGKEVYLPQTTGHEMRFLRYDPDMVLAAGRYGIPEPPEFSPVWDGCGRTIVLVPGAAFSPDGYRIGYGGGYYDRFFAERGSAAASRKNRSGAEQALQDNRPDALQTVTGAEYLSDDSGTANTLMLVGLAYDFQITQQIVPEPHDVRLDAVVTPEQLLKIS